ncbi:UNKNOWN [Stylonychia lemnae]|uniref:Uncharacterized protein n=1 Tax=Stylonychia lemnae TaxID=5949 RepID=A0A078A033_STYLE|nr:UNKNOWN [Stylonychia lemnae]|eukprot:CDW75242.1 UNKNOWN [Stylonychia lemnae]
MEDDDNVMRSLDMSDTQSFAVLRESIKELEEKVLNQSREAMQKLQSYEMKIQSYQRKIAPLDELASLTTGSNSSIVDSLSNKIGNLLENRFNQIFRAMYLDKLTFEKYQTDTEEKIQLMKEDHQDLKSNVLDFRGDTVSIIGTLQSETQKIYDLIRQTNDDLELKAGTAYVKSLCATKDEVTEVQKQFNNYTPLKRFQNYIVTMNEELGKRDIVLEDMLDKQNLVLRLIESTKVEINTNYLPLERFNEFYQRYQNTSQKYQLDITNLDNLAMKAAEDIMELEKIITTRAHQSEIQKLWENFPNYCSYQDLKDLYSKVLPPLAHFEEKMDRMNQGYEQSKEMIRRYDEIISDKANKVAINEIYQYVNETFVKQNPYNTQHEESSKKIDQLFINLSDLKDTLQVITEGITRDIHQAVKKATNQVRTQMHNSYGSNSNASIANLSNIGSGVGLDAMELKKLLIQKVDQNELDKVMLMKSNKADMEQAFKSIDIIHKQVCHQIVLFIELVKTCIEQHGHQENKKTKEQRKIFILQQAISVCRWINTFNPENINNEDLILPLELRSLQDHSKNLVSDFPRLDQVAEIGLKKFKVRELSSLKNEASSVIVSPTHLSPKNEKELVSQQLDKYITMSLSTSRDMKKGGEKGQRQTITNSRQNITKSLQVDLFSITVIIESETEIDINYLDQTIHESSQMIKAHQVVLNLTQITKRAISATIIQLKRYITLQQAARILVLE